MKLVDIHAHLDFEVFDNDRTELIKQIEQNNIIVYSNSVSLKNYYYSKELFKNTNNIKVSPGLYPTEADNITDKELKEVLTLLETEEYELIGEVGLDGSKSKTLNLNKQIEILHKIIKIGIKKDKAIVLHTRKAEKEVLDIIEYYVKKNNFKKFCLHCFMGKKKYHAKIKELGVYCSIPLSVTKSEQFQNLVEFLPMNKILVETDSPFLNPEKTRNSPLNIPLIYDKIAEIKKYDKTEIKNIIYNNYLKFIN